MKLRYYQQAAVDAINNTFARPWKKSALVVIPTGGGKTPVIAEIVKSYYKAGKRVCILTHRSELIMQNAQTLTDFMGDAFYASQYLGIYCAKLNRKETEQPIIIASIQSVGKKAHMFKPFDLVVIDEVHLLSPSGNTLYQRFLDNIYTRNNNLKLLGLTATPYRMQSGYIYEGDDVLFDEVCYEISIAELIYEEFLSPIISKNGRCNFDIKGIKKAGGEFVQSELNAKLEAQLDVFEDGIKEIIELGAKRNSWVLFTNSIKQVEMVQHFLDKHGIDNASITGDTPTDVRAHAIEQFKQGQLRCIVNCKVLTTGFDAPNIDLIGLLMATASPGLYAQIVGRGTRNHPGKENCLILDYGGNVKRHGCIDDVKPRTKKAGNHQAPVKQCPNCRTYVHTRAVICAFCNYEFPAPEGKALYAAYDGDMLKTCKFDIKGIRVQPHYKADKPEMFKIAYCVDIDGEDRAIYEYFCPNHGSKSNWACRQKLKSRYRGNFSLLSIDNTINSIKKKPVPRYLLAKQNEKGFFNVISVGFD